MKRMNYNTDFISILIKHTLRRPTHHVFRETKALNLQYPFRINQIGSLCMLFSLYFTPFWTLVLYSINISRLA